MLRNSRQHLRSSYWRVSSKSAKSSKEASAINKLSHNQHHHHNSRRFSTAPNVPSASHGQRAAAYITAGATVGAITCYRPNSMIAQDPYNLGGSILAVLAHNVVNPTANVSWLVLVGALAAGEFLGNGFRVIHQQYSSITITDQDRHQLLDDVSKIIIAETKVKDMDQDMLDVFENCISTIVLVAKTRWMHLTCNNGSQVPDQMTTEDLRAAILRIQRKEGKDDELTKEALLQVLSVADINNDGIITFMEFSRALLLLEFAKKDNLNAKSELYFRAIDLANNGTINQEELLHFAKRLHALGGIPHKDRTTPHWSGLYERPTTPEEVCAKWMDRFDVNHDGLISREEFGKMAEEIDFGQSFVFTKYFDKTMA